MCSHSARASASASRSSSASPGAAERPEKRVLQSTPPSPPPTASMPPCSNTHLLHAPRSLQPTSTPTPSALACQVALPQLAFIASKELPAAGSRSSWPEATPLSCPLVSLASPPVLLTSFAAAAPPLLHSSALAPIASLSAASRSPSILRGLSSLAGFQIVLPLSPGQTMHSLRSRAPRLYWYRATSNAAHVHLAARSSATAAGSTAFAGSQI